MTGINRQPKQIKIIHWNADGYTNKTEEIQLILMDHQPDILLLNETKLRENQAIKHRGYRVASCDGENGQRGVAALIKRSLPCAVREVHRELGMQATVLEIGTGVGLTAIYNSPRHRLSRRALEKLLGRTEKHLIVGDLNAKHIN